MGKSKAINKIAATAQKPSRAQAEEAVRTLISWAGDDPQRAGMAQTPQRVLAFYEEFFKGYGLSPSDYAESIANDVSFDDFIMVSDIKIVSFCEHHMLPATGTAHIAYIPGEKVAGIGTIAKIAADCAARFTTQEDLTQQIADTVQSAFCPQGAAVMTRLSHGCMTLRGPQQSGSAASMTKFSGNFAADTDIQKRFFMLINAASETDAPATK